MVTKTTAVEWLVEQLNKHGDMAFNKEITLGEYHIKKQEIIKQAKKIERDNLILFGAQCMVESEKQSGIGVIKIYELYYNINFNN